MPILRTKRWGDYPNNLREIADSIAAPWLNQAHCCLGPHMASGPHGSYSLLEPNGGRSKDRVVKIFIMKPVGRPFERVFVGIRSHTNNDPIPERRAREHRLQNLEFQNNENNRMFFEAINQTGDPICFRPDLRVYFKCLCVHEDPSEGYLISLQGFIERCLRQYTGVEILNP